MNITNVTEGITRITTNVENILFEGFWDLPDGVSLNSYIIKGEKTAIVDGVLCYSDLADHFKKALNEMDATIETVDYLIINHMEPDHSGWISTIEKLKPEAKILCSQKSAALLDAFFEHTKNVEVVKEGDSVDLGAGRVLQFIDIPNVHWPDTIATFDTLSGTLFSCDAFGSYGNVRTDGYDDMLDDKTLDFYESEALRYYANIIAAFSLFVDKAVAKCRALPINIIAPGHGIVWRKDPKRIIDDYARYASYQKGPCKKEATLLWGSMYGMTGKAVDIIVEEFEKANIPLHIHNVSEDTWSHMLASVWKSQGVVLAMPTYEYKM
ncbi:MAG: FprA family A-type flavoprotein, partial [Eubacteriales bacterium]